MRRNKYFAGRNVSGHNKPLMFVLRYAPIILFLLIFVTFGLLSEQFLQYQSLENIVKSTSYIGIVAVGMTFVLLTGGIDLSVGTNMYLSTVVAGLLIQNFDAPLWAAFLACLGTGLLFGAFNALLIVRFNMMPFIVTLGMLVAGRGVGLLLTQSRGIILPMDLLKVSSSDLFGIPLAILVFGVVVLLAHIVLTQTPLGRQIYAVGNHRDSAEKAGIKTQRTLTAVYLISGFCAALGGFVAVAQLGIVNAAFGEFSELDAIAASVLGGASLFGGVGSVFPGTVLGAVLIQMIQSGLVFVRVDIYIQPLIQAAIIFLAVLLDSIRNARLAKLGRRNIRVEADTTKH